MMCVLSSTSLPQMPGGRRLVKRSRALLSAASGAHTQSAVGSAGPPTEGADKQHENAAVVGPLTERNSGKFRFWHDERRFKGPIDRCLVQKSLFASGGVRTGGYPKTAPVSGPLGHQRPADWDLLWSPARSALKALPTLRAGQLVSAVPGMYSLTKKRRLSASLKAAYGDQAWQLMPKSYSLPTELADWKSSLDQQVAAGEDPGPWMLKTAQHLGKGLVLLPAADAYRAATQPRLPSAKPFVLAQRYISDPLLMDGCKFGIRVWLLITGLDPFTAYLHNQGLVLFSTDSFDLESLSDEEGTAGKGHITNYAQNVNGTVWNLAMLKKHLGAEVHRKLWAKIVRNAAHTACAALNDIRQEQTRQQLPPNSTFELLGLDYLVDSSMHPWLLEVNGTPSLAVAHHDPEVEQLIRDTKGSMVQDMFTILDVQHRFLPCYGMSKSGAKLTGVQAQRARIALSRSNESQAKARVDAELQSRGGFIPLMGHFPVMRFAAGTVTASSAGSTTPGSQEQLSSNAEEHQQGSPQQQQQHQHVLQSSPLQEAASPLAAASAGDGAGGPGPMEAAELGIQFSESDKRLFVYMQQWWQRHRASTKRARKSSNLAGS